MCDYIDNDDQHQFSITELDSLMKKVSSEEECYTARHLKVKLQEHYRNSLIITNESGKETIYTFLNEGNRILREHYRSTGLMPEDITDMATAFTNDQGQSKVYDTSVYPKL